MQLSNQANISVIANDTASGSSTITTSSWDIANYDSFLVLGAVGTPDPTNTVQLQNSADNVTFANVTPVAGLLATGANKNFQMDVNRPTKRYHRLVITRAVATTIETLYVLLYNSRAKSETFPKTGASGVLLISP